MQSCLGITIAENLIKYAKVEKESNSFKVKSYGIKFFDNLELGATINQIIDETDSRKIPISVNTSNEKYYYLNIFNLTNENYAKKAIQTEFESFCGENHLNANTFEGRYTYTRDALNTDRNKVIYIYNSKVELEQTYNMFKGARLTTATPISIALPNIVRAEKNKNVMIVDIDTKTTITTMLNQNIYNIDILNQGLKEALETINEKENSLLKSYEVCKNTTIYTMDMQSSQNMGENSEYLSYIVPCLYKIAQELQNIIKNYKHIDTVYLTGLGSVINNVDLYFQEYLQGTKVEILKPFFLDNNSKVNLKDYIEVNSAIALAIQGLGFGVKTLNFAKGGVGFDGLKKLASMDLKDLKDVKIEIPKLNFDFKGSMDRIEVSLTTYSLIVVIIAIVFCIASTFLKNSMNVSISKAEDMISYTTKQIALVNSDDNKIIGKTQDYQKYKSNLENTSSAIETKRSRKNQITTMLNKIIYTIPKEAQITEIRNTEKLSSDGNATVQHITIYVQSKGYDKLAYFKAQLKSANVLDNIVSTEGVKDGEYVKIAIEGDLKTY